jgi:uncharacterized repeat protein (TIGR01451 family)
MKKQHSNKLFVLFLILTFLFQISFINVPVAKAQDTTTISLEKGSWDIIGLDSNKPLTEGPDQFYIEVEVDNTGGEDATNVQAELTWTTQNPYIDLHPNEINPKSLGTINAGDTKYVFFIVKVDRDSNAYFTSRDYKIRVWGNNFADQTISGDVNTGGLYVEKFVSQNRNSVISITPSTTTPAVGEIFTIEVKTQTTGGGNFDNITTPLLTFDPGILQPISVTTTYNNATQTTHDILLHNSVSDMDSVWTVKAVNVGSTNFGGLIYDHSGSSFHYNSDYGENTAISVVAPSINVSKTVTSSGPYFPGSTVTYDVYVKNTGDIALSPVTVTDTLPTGLTYSSATPAPDNSSNPYTWTISSLAPGASTTIHLKATVDNDASGNLTNSTTAKGYYGSGSSDYVEDTDQATISVTNPPLDPPMGYKVGTNNSWPVVQWKQVWINSQNTTSVKVKIIDPIPANATYLPNSLQYEARGSSTTDSCYYDETHNWIIWEGTMGPDFGATNEENAQNEVIIKFRTTVTSGYTVENQAKAYWDQNNDGEVNNNDPDVANNTPVVTDDPTTSTPDDPTVVKEPPVGGIVYPVNKFTLILPWLLLFLSLVFMAYLLYKKRRLSLKNRNGR